MRDSYCYTMPSMILGPSHHPSHIVCKYISSICITTWMMDVLMWGRCFLFVLACFKLINFCYVFMLLNRTYTCTNVPSRTSIQFECIFNYLSILGSFFFSFFLYIYIFWFYSREDDPIACKFVLFIYLTGNRTIACN